MKIITKGFYKSAGWLPESYLTPKASEYTIAFMYNSPEGTVYYWLVYQHTDLSIFCLCIAPGRQIGAGTIEHLIWARERFQARLDSCLALDFEAIEKAGRASQIASVQGAFDDDSKTFTPSFVYTDPEYRDQGLINGLFDFTTEHMEWNIVQDNLRVSKLDIDTIEPFKPSEADENEECQKLKKLINTLQKLHLQ